MREDLINEVPSSMECSWQVTKESARQVSGIKNVGVTKYKVIDDNFVEGVTATEDGRVVAVIIRRGSLELPLPSKARRRVDSMTQMTNDFLQEL